MDGGHLWTAQACGICLPSLAETSRFLTYDSAFSALCFLGFEKHLRMCGQVVQLSCGEVLMASIRDQQAPCSS